MNGRRVTALIVACALPGTALAVERFGVAASDGVVACAAVAGITQPQPVSVDIVVLGAPQRTLAGTMTAAIAQPCAALAARDLAGPFFLLRLDRADAFAPGELGVVRLRPLPAVTPDARRPVEFRACASSEGVHVTAWQGKPLHGRRLWHEYVYVGQELEPSCSSKDFD